MSMEQQSKLKQNMFTLVVITIAAAMIYGLPYFRSYGNVSSYKYTDGDIWFNVRNLWCNIIPVWWGRC